MRRTTSRRRSRAIGGAAERPRRNGASESGAMAVGAHLRGAVDPDLFEPVAVLIERRPAAALPRPRVGERFGRTPTAARQAAEEAGMPAFPPDREVLAAV